VNKRVSIPFSDALVKFIKSGNPGSLMPQFRAQDQQIMVVNSNNDTGSVTFEVSSSIKVEECKFWGQYKWTQEHLGGVATKVNVLHHEPLISLVVNRYIVRMFLRYGKAKLIAGGVGLLLVVLLLCAGCGYKLCRRKESSPKKQQKGKNKLD